MLAGFGCDKKFDRGVALPAQGGRVVAPLPTIAPVQRSDVSAAPEQGDKKADDKKAESKGGAGSHGWGSGSGRLTHQADVKLYVQAQALAVGEAKAKVEMLQKHAEEVKEILAKKKGSMSPAAYKHWKGSRRRLHKAQGPSTAL